MKKRFSFFWHALFGETMRKRPLFGFVFLMQTWITVIDCAWALGATAEAAKAISAAIARIARREKEVWDRSVKVISSASVWWDFVGGPETASAMDPRSSGAQGRLN